MAIFDVTQDEFEQRVVERSREVPVVVDFWADWCGPCKALGPVIERAVAAREGKVDLAKLDVDSNQGIAQAFGIRGIPAVKAFKDGRVADEFTGALPAPQVEAFLDRIVPSEAEELAQRGAADGDETALRRALELDPRRSDARAALARMLLARNDAEEASRLLADASGDFLADALSVRARLALDGDDSLEPAFDAWDQGDHERALELMREALDGSVDSERRDQIRRLMVGIFTELGPDSPLAREHRRRLAAALS